MKILGISGSARNGSYNTMLLHAAKEHLPAGVELEIANIGVLPLYNQDLEASYPAEATALKEKIRAADGILIATPEHNRSIPAALKNALDWSSRPYGDNALTGKPVYVIGASGGNVGTALAQAELRKILLYLDAHVMGQPEFYLNYTDKFDQNGVLTDEKTKELLTKALAQFAAFIQK